MINLVTIFVDRVVIFLTTKQIYQQLEKIKKTDLICQLNQSYFEKRLSSFSVTRRNKLF